MKNDELLATIDWIGKAKDGESGTATALTVATLASLNALRAVVELHKPIEEDGKLWCRAESCYNHIEFLERTDCDCGYPCPTIQAIERELS